MYTKTQCVPAALSLTSNLKPCSVQVLQWMDTLLNIKLVRGAYGIENAHTVLRGTLRYKGYADAMQTLFETGLFAQTKMNLAGFTWVKFKYSAVYHSFLPHLSLPRFTPCIAPLSQPLLQPSHTLSHTPSYTPSHTPCYTSFTHPLSPPPSYTPFHIPFTSLSHPLLHPLLHLTHTPSHTPLTPLSYPLSYPSHTPLTPLLHPLSQPSHTPLTTLSHPYHTPHTPLPLTPSLPFS